MNADALTTFAAVARTGGITRAAVELHTVQSNVTAKVKQLEAELGVSLFHRHSRGMTLTDAGAQLLPYASRVGHLLDEARRAATDCSVASGQLIVGAMETTAALRLPPILLSYARQCPAVDVMLKTGTSQELVADVLERRLQGALVAAPVLHPELLCEPVIQEELVLVSAPGAASLAHALEGQQGKLGLKALVFRSGCSYRRRLEHWLTARRMPAPRWLEFGTLEGIIGCVAAGLGVTLLPRAVVAGAARAKRVAMHDLFGTDEATVDTLLVRRRDAFVSTAFSQFAACVRSHDRRVDYGV